MATGVLILGIGSGTKQLSRFLECTKSYEAVVLFGVATDTYDAVGKVVARKPYEHITKATVEEALQKFRGKIMQRPPIFSALRVQGKRLYEYAREGKEVPKEIEERPMTVEHLEMLEWMEGGTHSWQWPTEIAGTPERQFAEKALPLSGAGNANWNNNESSLSSAKRKHLDEDTSADDHQDAETAASHKRHRATPPSEVNGDQEPKQETTSTPPDTNAVPQTSSPCPAPACRIRMTVTSGFYVRSLCHDLGAAVGSLALMSNLIRTRQGDFELDKNVLEYSDLDKGDEVWEPKVGSMLEAWQANERTAGAHQSVNSSPRSTQRASPTSWRHKDKPAEPNIRTNLKRRNSSSDEG